MGNSALQPDLFGDAAVAAVDKPRRAREPFGRLDADPDLHAALLPYCRLAPGDIWEDMENGHRVGVLDAAKAEHLVKILQGTRPALAVNDPPYNVAVGRSLTTWSSPVNGCRTAPA